MSNKQKYMYHMTQWFTGNIVKNYIKYISVFVLTAWVNMHAYACTQVCLQVLYLTFKIVWMQSLFV